MRRKIVAGNWKMNKTLPEATQLASEVAERIGPTGQEGQAVILAPPTPFLDAVVRGVGNAAVNVAAQDCSAYASGAYTGEVAASMIHSTGARYVIIGHSERRAYHNESNELTSQKVDRALAVGLQVILCCGETLEQRESNVHQQLVNDQVKEAIGHLTATDFERVIIAYEPVWAIGTGVTASPEQAQEMHALIRANLANLFGPDAADNCSILYGGSCKPGNAAELFACADIDGGLIGGASLNADDFCAIVDAL